MVTDGPNKEVFTVEEVDLTSANAPRVKADSLANAYLNGDTVDTSRIAIDSSTGILTAVPSKAAPQTKSPASASPEPTRTSVCLPK